MPRGFHFPDHFVEFWVPYPLPTGRRATLQRTSPIARLADGVDPSAAAEEVTAILARVRVPESGASTPTRVEVLPLKDQLVAPVRPALLVLTAAVGLVLLIACVNVANLLFSRSVAREREIAMRRALGASTGRLMRQMLAESVLLAGAGGMAAIVVAVGAVRLLQMLGAGMPRRDLSVVAIPRLDEISIDVSVLAFAVTASLVTGLLFGLAPALRLARLQPLDALRTAASPIHSGFSLLRRQRTQGLLIVAEIAIAVMLSAQGGLLIRSFSNLTSVDAGYRADGVLTFQVAMPGGRAAGERVAAMADRLVRRLREVPGVVAAAYSEHVAMVQIRSGTPLRRTAEAPSPSAGSLSGGDVHAVSREFLSMMGMRVVAGRAFDDRDGAGQPQVMLINEALARTGIFGDNPVGQLIYAFGPASKAPWQVIGVVADVRQYGLDQPAVPQVFIEMRQAVGPDGRPLAIPEYFAVRTDESIAAVMPKIRQVLSEIDVEATVENVATMNDLVSNSVGRPRLYAVLVAIFAAIAVSLAVIGIYGVLSYLVVQRVREIGVRMALGADRWRVMRLVVGDVIVVALVGTAVGLAGAAAMTRSLSQLLFGLSPFDPATFAVTGAFLIAVAVLSAYVPAYRAAKVDPLVALRCQ